MIGLQSVTTPSPSHFVRLTTVDLVYVSDPYSESTDLRPEFFVHVPDGAMLIRDWHRVQSETK